MAFGQFMALIDIQIVAASLNEVQAGLSAGPDEISWVQTAYLMAELVMIPFAAFLAQALSTRWLFALSAGLFTLASALCGLAWSIESMIVFRAIQGFVGGAMVPTVFATGFALFYGQAARDDPGDPRHGLGARADARARRVGGWITDALGLALGVLHQRRCPARSVTRAGDRADPRRPRRTSRCCRRIDWVHLASMAVFLAGLEYVLEEGPKNGWFDDTHIAVAAWVSLVAFVLFLERSFRSDGPIVQADAVPQADLRLRLRVQPGDRVRALCRHLSGPDLPRPGARLQRVGDRHDGVRRRHRAVARRADRRRPVAARRSADHDHASG